MQVGSEHQAAASLSECSDFGSSHSACLYEGYLSLESCHAAGQVVAVDPVRQDYDNYGMYLIDANPQTVWESQNGAEEVKIVLDLKEEREVGVVIVKWAGHASARHVKVSAGSSCSSLDVVYPETSQPSDPLSWDETNTLTFSTRRVRILVLTFRGLQDGMRNFQIRDVVVTASLTEDFQSLELFVDGKQAIAVGEEAFFEFVAGPSVTDVSPESGPADTELQIQIELDASHCTENIFQGEIWIGQKRCNVIKCTTSLVSCTVPEQSAGTYPIVVRVASLGLAHVPDSMKFQQDVKLVSVVPNEGGLGGGQLITVAGSGFGADLARVKVRVCDDPCTIVSLSSSSIVCARNNKLDFASSVGSYARSVTVSSASDEATEDISTGIIMPGRLGFSFPGGDSSAEWSHHEVFLRFVGLDIPRGSQVTEANLRIRAGRKCPKGVIIRLWAEKADSSTAFESSQLGSLSSRPRTPSLDWNLTISWNWMSEEHESVDLKDLLQHVVGRDGWTSKSNFTLILSQEKIFPSIACQMVGYNVKSDWAPTLQVSLATSRPGPTVADTDCPVEVDVVPSRLGQGESACPPSHIKLRSANKNPQALLHKDFYLKEPGKELYFGEARALCRLHGARLCTLEEIFSERARGRDMRQPFFGLQTAETVVPVNVPPPRFEIGDSVKALRKWGRYAGRWYNGLILSYRKDVNDYKYEVHTEGLKVFLTGDEVLPRGSKEKDAFEKPDVWSSANNRWAWVSEKQSVTQVHQQRSLLTWPSWGEKYEFSEVRDPEINRRYTVGTPCCGQVGHAAYMAIDNSSTTYWQSPPGAIPTALKFEIVDGVHAVRHVKIEWTEEYATEYSIELSEDGVDFVEVLMVSGSDGHSDEHTLGRYNVPDSAGKWKWVQIVLRAFRPGRTRVGIRELTVLAPSMCGAVTALSGVPGQTFQTKKSQTPEVSTVYPARGTTAGGSDVTITGRFLVSDVSLINVTFGDFPCHITRSNQMDEAGKISELVCMSGASGVTEGGLKYVLVTVEGFGSSLPSTNNTFWYIDTWSARTTWGGMPPPTGCGTWHDDKLCKDSVVIPSGQVVLLDISLPRFYLILIQGTLIFEDTRDLEMSASYILVHQGTLQIGTEQVPHMHKAKIILYGHPKQVELPTFGSKVIACYRCTLDMHGTPQISW